MSGPVGNLPNSTRTLRYQTHVEGDEAEYNALPLDLREAFVPAVERVKALVPTWDSNIELLPFGLVSLPGCRAQGHKEAFMIHLLSITT